MSFKKLLLLVGLFIALFGVPIFLASNLMMDWYQGIIDQHHDKSFYRSLQLTMAGVCFKTMRPERAATYYGVFLYRYPQDERRPFALLRYAESLEESKRQEEAIELYQQFLDDYPQHELTERALNGLSRVRLLRGQ